MIDHEHKLIFIHISKCAGTSIENAFGLLKKKVNKADYKNLYGWCDKHQLFLHHATPQQLFDLGHLDEKTWDDYYTFIIIRDPWDRSYSDYVWMLKQVKGFGSFKQFINREGVFQKRLTVKDKYYRGDHLNQQSDYLFLHNQKLHYNKVLKFENLKTELPDLEEELGLEKGFFSHQMKRSLKKFKHYSIFYNRNKKSLVDTFFADDIKNLPYSYKDHFRYSYLKNFFFLFYHFGIKNAIKKYLKSVTKMMI
ncbi:sulfotransferase family protein [Subsaxibacter sp. CAU 1640]|uniref:sulfotransferase family 2 domain-containing protein n=1 Tax=Subsaxibacter sp. CAU 1640 TaxID=2933271 RepID=UPI00200316CE|nr:sulfotransferase family 2 domain-containing protein [Subsaxibacter sp. CAU 1640]MCK7589900.1 sulfotransferase family protein [Subsaxibacter sp. CAU 1640]